MFSIFTGLNYIYTLSFNGIPFYAGCTNNPVKRFRGHYYWNDCKTYNFVRYNLVTFGKYATIDLIACHEDRNAALKMEGDTIGALDKAGFVLLNQTKRWYVRNDTRMQPPIYQHFKKLPSSWFNANIINEIKNKMIKTIAEYEQTKSKY